MDLTVNTSHPTVLDTNVIDPFINTDISELPIPCQKFEEIRTNCKYHDVTVQPQGNQNMVNNMPYHDNVTILHMNSRSILSDRKFEEMETFVYNSDVAWSIICICETWLTPDMEDRRQLQGYTGFFHSRDSSQGGGVAIYVSNKAEQTNILNIPAPVGAQSIFVECKFPHSETFIIGEVYRPPNLNSHVFLTEMESNLQLVTNRNKTVFIAGDFNYNLLSIENEPIVQEFFNIFTTYGFLPTISKTTRLSPDKMSVIDNIFTNNIGCVSGSGIIFNDMSDHFPIFITSTLSIHHQKRESIITKFDYRQLDTFKRHLTEALDAARFEHILDPEIACDTLLDAYKSGIEKCSIAFKPNRKNTAIKPWISPGILCSINHKNKLFAEKTANPTNERVRKYTYYKNMLNTIIREAKRLYYKKEIEANKQKPKELWKTLNTLTKGNKEPTKFPSVFLNENGEEISDREDIAEAFNTFFSTIGAKLQEKIPHTTMNPVDYLPDTDEIHLQNMEPTNQNELRNIIKNMKNVGAGADGINAKIFKGTYRDILEHILHLMNLCLQNGIFPKRLKIAVIKPVFKAGKKNTLGNYRPISMLPYISKILEKLIHERLTTYLITNNIVNESQYGFQKGLSTYMPHIILQEQITKAFEHGHFVCGIYLDLKKAFDTVDPEILMLKLEKYGICQSALQMIRSYLSSRTQCVNVDGVKSTYMDVEMGVPQGSILGPLLFLLYINDFPNICKHSSCILYADDTALFFESNDANKLQDMLNNDLPNICKWLQANKLSLNTDKTYCQLYNMTRKVVKPIVALNGKDISFVTKMKYLGVLIDEKLSWNEHIDYVSTTLSSNIGALYRSKYFLDQQTRLLLYNALILPHLNYCSLIWAHTFSSYISKIEILQKRAVRIIVNADRLAHTDPIYKQLKLLKVKQLAKLQMMLLAQKSLFQNVRPAIKSIFPLIEERPRNTRHIKHLKELYTDKLYKTRTIAWIGPRLWNTVICPKYQSIEDVPRSKPQMKRLTKEHFLNELPETH